MPNYNLSLLKTSSASKLLVRGHERGFFQNPGSALLSVECVLQFKGRTMQYASLLCSPYLRIISSKRISFRVPSLATSTEQK